MISVTCFICSYFQGGFTNWLDGSLLENIDWNNQQLGTQWPNNISILTRNKLVNVRYSNHQIIKILRLFNILDQPETDTDNNCTGVFTFIGCRARGWAAIHCNQKFLTTFVCLSLSNSTMDSIIYPLGSNELSRNFTCPTGWLFIEMKCFKFIQHNLVEHVSCRHAQYTCENEGGRLLSIGTIPQPKRVELLISDTARMIHSFSFAFGLKRHFTAEECAIMISDVPLKYDTKPLEISHILHLLEMLPFMSVQRPLVLPLFEISTETCFFLEHGYLQSMSQHKSDDIHFKRKVYWGVKAIGCNFEIEDATTFVCERLPFKFNTNCAAGHFTCEDDTCILTVYVCDDVKDCRNGKDEYGCQKKQLYSIFFIKYKNTSWLSSYLCYK